MLFFERSFRGVLHAVLTSIFIFILFLFTGETFESYAQLLPIDWAGWIGLLIIFTYLGLLFLISSILGRIISYSIIKH